MKILASILVAFAIAFAATSCGGGNSKAPSGTTGAATNQPAPVPTTATNAGSPGGSGPATTSMTNHGY
jgi:hypothetical protein